MRLSRETEEMDEDNFFNSCYAYSLRNDTFELQSNQKDILLIPELAISNVIEPVNYVKDQSDFDEANLC